MADDNPACVVAQSAGAAPRRRHCAWPAPMPGARAPSARGSS